MNFTVKTQFEWHTKCRQLQIHLRHHHHRQHRSRRHRLRQVITLVVAHIDRRQGKRTSFRRPPSKQVTGLNPSSTIATSWTLAVIAATPADPKTNQRTTMFCNRNRSKATLTTWPCESLVCLLSFFPSHEIAIVTFYFSHSLSFFCKPIRKSFLSLFFVKLYLFLKEEKKTNR